MDIATNQPPQDVVDAFDALKSDNRIPRKSKELYYKEYAKYQEWKLEHNIPRGVNTQETVGMYLEYMSKKVVPPSLFRILSMLKSTIAVEHGTILNTEDIQRILANKPAAKSYIPKQAPILTVEQIKEFIGGPNNLPDKVNTDTIRNQRSTQHYSF